MHLPDHRSFLLDLIPDRKDLSQEVYAVVQQANQHIRIARLAAMTFWRKRCSVWVFEDDPGGQIALPVAHSAKKLASPSVKATRSCVYIPGWDAWVQAPCTACRRKVKG